VVPGKHDLKKIAAHEKRKGRSKKMSDSKTNRERVTALSLFVDPVYVYTDMKISLPYSYTGNN
jgi:hypothetical protein